ncbi:carboxypeptidase Q isoform X3 [Vulpes vulpes]|uniref:Carboxypeptidase Q n=1 Tax=Vulpes vulpes TaxID=9627 RepID=A0ABM4YJ98_VULVU
MEFLLFTFVGVVHLLSLSSGKPIYKNDISRRTFQEIREEIASYGDVAKAIIDLAVYGKAQNRSYERLALLVDTVGPRPSGSRSLEKAIQIMYQNLREDGLENVHLEPVKIPHWERGEESAVMLEPRIHRMAILGLGSSIGTPPEGITAEVLVVTSFEELQRRAPEARGKIVVYNQPYVNYSTTVQYRVQGAVEAAKVGALASLIRSVASFSIYSPHTGIQEYQDGVPKIPTACITVEDAEMMSRMASRGNRIVIQLKMGAKNYPDADSFNTVAEIIGSKYPEQVVLVSGHLDSWDVGQGAMDDGGGAFISWEALSLIKDLGLTGQPGVSQQRGNHVCGRGPCLVLGGLMRAPCTASPASNPATWGPGPWEGCDPRGPCVWCSGLRRSKVGSAPSSTTCCTRSQPARRPLQVLLLPSLPWRHHDRHGSEADERGRRRLGCGLLRHRRHGGNAAQVLARRASPLVSSGQECWLPLQLMGPLDLVRSQSTGLSHPFCYHLS